ncbi:MAG: helix-turn-helix domain-containing protein, partial [Oscillatoria sp. Prado101]|nr:helix-turn-helix domain-containing protein [Oscillatoria sp. Prado101]
NTLISLAQNYGQRTDRGIEIYSIPFQDLADVADITLAETTKIMQKLREKGWIKIDTDRQTMHLINLKPLTQLAGHL